MPSTSQTRQTVSVDLNGERAVWLWRISVLIVALALAILARRHLPADDRPPAHPAHPAPPSPSSSAASTFSLSLAAR